MRISDWSSDVCSSDLEPPVAGLVRCADHARIVGTCQRAAHFLSGACADFHSDRLFPDAVNGSDFPGIAAAAAFHHLGRVDPCGPGGCRHVCCYRSEEHTSELQSLMRSSYAVFCLKKKTT